MKSGKPFVYGVKDRCTPGDITVTAHMKANAVNGTNRAHSLISCRLKVEMNKDNH
jgi:hypothetical protein